MVLVVHRKGENQDYIRMTCDFLRRNGKDCLSIHEDKKLNLNNSMEAWIRDCVQGYNIEGNARYDVFVLIGRYLDKQCRILLSIALQTGKPCFCLSNNMFSPIISNECWTKPDNDQISEVIL